MSSPLPQPATVSVDRRNPGIIHSVRVRWARFKQNRNSGSSPSYFEKDFTLGGGSTEGSTSVTGAPDEPQRKRDVYYAIPKGFSSRDGDENMSKFRSVRRRATRPPVKLSEPVENDPEEIVDVDVVVVDNSFEVGGQQESLTEPSAGPGAAEHQPSVAMQPGPGKISGGFGWDPKDKQHGLNLSSSQTHSQHDTGSMSRTGITPVYLQTILRFLRYGFSVFHGVFFPRFDDAAHEKQFHSQEWYLGKMLALIASGFLVINWVLACIFVPRPFVLFDHIFHFGIAPVFTLPLPIFIVFRWPVRHPTFYQIYLTISLWSWTYWYGLSIILCGYYSGQSVFTCGSKDFLGFFYFCTGFPAIGLFALGQRRVPAAIAATVTITLFAALIIPHRASWVMIIVNQICFHLFLIYINWSREMADRDRFVMSRQIKEAYLYRHRLQMREKQIQNSKQRLTGYIFHEVRVPLNTAMLAVQNIEASGSVIKPLELEFNALTGSLTVMSKVLNDVLDLNRMDAGKFESVNKPYAFHKVVESLLVPLRLAASAKGINLIEELDPRIDEFVLECLISAKKSKGTYDETEELEPWVVGDEMRCRQIFTNLTSNATKFCPPGGTVTVVTKLLWPSPPGAGAIPPVGPSDPEWHGIRSENVSSRTAASEHGVAHLNGQSTAPGTHSGSTKSDDNGRIPAFANLEQEKGKCNAPSDGRDYEEDYMEKPTLNVPIDQVVIRIEIRDTGIGIKKKDVHDAKLFSPYVQTEIGRHQGGKGTGLGLALVRRIVKLSGGRLGVKSKFQQGSSFWVELPLGVGNRAIHAQSAEGGSRDVSIRSPPMAPTRARDFAIDQSSVYTNPTVNNDYSAQASFNLSPPAPHFSHRTIMEQQGRVEMTPSRPELRNRREMPISPLNDTEISRLAETQFFASDTQAVLTPPQILEVSRNDTSSSAPAVLEPKTNADAVTISLSVKPSPKIHPAESLPPQPEPLQVLVVDDDSLTRKLMTRLLTRLGCIVTTGENGVKALEILLGPVFTPSESAPSTIMSSTPGTSSTGFENNAPTQPRFFDVVFLDNQMPLMSGLEAIARLRAAGREDLVVGVTGNALIRDQDEYLTAGVDHVLIKPVLEKSLRQILSLAERRRAAAAAAAGKSMDSEY